MDFFSRFVNPFFRRSSAITEPSATTKADISTDTEGVLELPGGATIAYQVVGSQYLGNTTPIVLIPGMSSLVTDYEALTSGLAKTNTLLLFNHRGMGTSRLTDAGDETLSIELMARDVVQLIALTGWEKVTLIGYSMGGVIAQQILTLPFHDERPLPLPFTITHVALISTRARVHASTGLKLISPQRPATLEERKAATRRVVASLLDPDFIQAHPEKYEKLCARATSALEPGPILGQSVKQGLALLNFKFDHLLEHIPRETKIMVIHGKLDTVIPPQCGEEILACIPWARSVEVGDGPGQAPSLNFAHYFYEYFEPEVWHGVFAHFFNST
ncbi:Alpha/Beta hydrolase protein [Coprinopsis sp. MPI-PUGE-AT-0042]|nr:Alpha/Beta hydrolase protein [Coprinopsis sp. MPI-PUGE-AT-0042]